MAQGFFAYWGRLDYDTALREFETALELSPSSSELLQAIGYVERRRGRWEESLGRFAEALRYDPRSGIRNFDVGDNYFSLRMYPEADHYFERAMTLSPEWANPYVYRAWLQVVWRGDTARGRAYIREGLTRIEPGRFAPSFHGGDRISASLVTADPGFWPMSISWMRPSDSAISMKLPGMATAAPPSECPTSPCSGRPIAAPTAPSARANSGSDAKRPADRPCPGPS